MTDMKHFSLHPVYSQQMITDVEEGIYTLLDGDEKEQRLCLNILDDVLCCSDDNLSDAADNISKLSARMRIVTSKIVSKEDRVSFSHSIQMLWDRTIDQLVQNGQIDDAVHSSREGACLSHQSTYFQRLASNTWLKLVDTVAQCDYAKALQMAREGHAFRCDMKLDVIFGASLRKADFLLGNTEVTSIEENNRTHLYTSGHLKGNPKRNNVKVRKASQTFVPEIRN